jgi:excisionase family DNA binding protein
VTAQLLTTREVASRLGVSSETVLQWVETRGLPAHRLTSRAIRFDADELDAWIAEHATGAANREVLPTRSNRARKGAYAPVPFPSLPTPPLDAATTEEET